MTQDTAYALKVIAIAAANGSIVSNVDQIINMIDRMTKDTTLSANKDGHE